jgi:hypothetical protein
MLTWLIIASMLLAGVGLFIYSRLDAGKKKTVKNFTARHGAWLAAGAFILYLTIGAIGLYADYSKAYNAKEKQAMMMIDGEGHVRPECAKDFNKVINDQAQIEVNRSGVTVLKSLGIGALYCILLIILTSLALFSITHVPWARAYNECGDSLEKDAIIRLISFVMVCVTIILTASMIIGRFT